ncbi:MAG TPA: recombination protein NinB [Fluviicoccus sp.]|nr:recombination protein NinB [Fluviicoccus sp.]
MASLYKEFVLNGPAAWQAFKTIVRANAKAFNDNGNPLRIILTSSDRKRSSEANAYYWAFLLEQIADQAWVEGRQYSKDVWHEYFAGLYAEKIEIPLPDGTIHIRRKSTTEMKVAEFSDYLQKVEAYAATELGVRFIDSRYHR